MRKLAIITAAALTALAVFCAFGDWVYEAQWGSLGYKHGYFRWPTGVALAPGGRVYVCDSSNYRIQYFTRNGSYLGYWGGAGYGNGRFDIPIDIALTKNGEKVYVVDHRNHRVQYFTATGSFIGKWG